MNALDLLIILVFFLLVIFAGIGISAVTLAVLTGVLFVVRMLRGEKI